MVVQFGGRFSYNVGQFRQGILEEILSNSQDYPYQKEYHAV